MRRLASLFASMLAAMPTAAFACTVPAGYLAPTNYQLAGAANLVVLGQVVGGGTGSPAEPAASTIVVHPIVALKGLLPGADFALGGMRLAAPGDAAAGSPGDPLAFAGPPPAPGPGACIRRTFPLNAEALFFLDRANGEWVPAGGPLSRWAEDVPGLDAPWVELAQLYAQASMMPADQGREKLETRREALLTRRDDPAAAAMAADLARSLAGPAAPAPADDLGAVKPTPDDFKRE